MSLHYRHLAAAVDGARELSADLKRTVYVVDAVVTRGFGYRLIAPLSTDRPEDGLIVRARVSAPGRVPNLFRINTYPYGLDVLWLNSSP